MTKVGETVGKNDIIEVRRGKAYSDRMWQIRDPSLIFLYFGPTHGEIVPKEPSPVVDFVIRARLIV